MPKPATDTAAVEHGTNTTLGQAMVEIAIELGQTRLPINTLLDWAEGSLLELNSTTDTPLAVKVDGEPFAQGELVSVGEHFGVRILSLVNEDSDKD